MNSIRRYKGETTAHFQLRLLANSEITERIKAIKLKYCDLHLLGVEDAMKKEILEFGMAIEEIKNRSF